MIDRINTFVLIPIKNSIGKVWINNESVGKSQFPCGKNILWKIVNVELNANKENSKINPIETNVVIPPYLISFCNCFSFFL